jgi:integrase
VKQIVDAWTAAAGIGDGLAFRAINKSDRLSGDRIGSQAIYEILKTCGVRAGIPFAPHDLRRTFARAAHDGGAPIEQIQYCLGHASLLTTERYLGLAQDLKHAPGDYIRIVA